MWDSAFFLFVLAVGISYVYAFVGGFTDAANAIATSVGTRVLSPKAAVSMAGVCNLLGGLTGTAVAATIGRGIVNPEAMTLTTVVAGVAGSMTWSLLTYRFGIPVSETHGLVGGLIGAGLASSGIQAVRFEEVREVLLAIALSPLLGFIGGAVLILLIYWVFRHKSRPALMPWFRNLQRASAAFMAFSHGRNDAQKPMGVLALAIALRAGETDVSIPLWIVLSCSAVAALGTALGGWRIIRTVGMRVTHLDPVQGFASEVAGASVLQIASNLGVPVSTTHAITASIMGVGATRRLSAVRWPLMLQIVASWVLTIPSTVALGAGLLLLLRAVVGNGR